jgi:hypothetical protein
MEDINSSTSLVVDYDGDGNVDVQVSVWSEPDLIIEESQSATTTPELEAVAEKKNSSGTKIGFKNISPSPLVAGASISTNPNQTELLKQILILLEKYRDLLIIINKFKV